MALALAKSAYDSWRATGLSSHTNTILLMTEYNFSFRKLSTVPLTSWITRQRKLTWLQCEDDKSDDINSYGDM